MKEDVVKVNMKSDIMNIVFLEISQNSSVFFKVFLTKYKILKINI